MADDGLLVNFSIDDCIIGAKPVFRGGRWKDRLRAKQSAEYRLQKIQGGAKLTGSNAVPKTIKEQAPPNDEPTPARPSKRQKVGDSTGVRHKTSTNDIVSSLFTSNPTSKAPAEDHGGDIPPATPSNAPLLDSLHTFTSLGLSPVLATHLLSKFSLTSPTAIQKSAISQLLADDSDAFIQAETGSGKTLAYLLPIVQRIMQLSSPPLGPNPTLSEPPAQQVHRASGLFAIILAPTRELCKQISTVLESLLRCAHWIVAGNVIGGEKKKSEKARLRKGLNILVATPGRLADHLDNTKVLDVSRVRWLVLDEGDRLMELGFEEAIRGIVSKLEERSKESKATGAPETHGLPSRRTTIMCSATMKMTVHRLGEISLRDAVHIKADATDASGAVAGGSDAASPEEAESGRKKEPGEVEFLAPAQLQQTYAIVPPKQRLVTLAALLKRLFVRKGSVMKAIVFLSCADSVDFHFDLFARPEAIPATIASNASVHPNVPSTANEGNPTTLDNGMSPAENRPTSDPQHFPPKTASPPIPTTSPAPTLTSMQNPHLVLYKLHGSLTQPLRTATLAAFTRSVHPCILLCTDVASRGLDVPNVDVVIEYDPPFSADDHLHRVGRTARAGREGRAVIFLMPGPEEGYVNVLKKGYRDGLGRGLRRTDAEEVLRKGFGQVRSNGVKGSREGDWEERATEWQLQMERWVIGDQAAREMARKAFVSHVRAYATHVAKERELFDVKELHLGHLAKAFALRERPGNMGRGTRAIDKIGTSSRDAKKMNRGISQDQQVGPGRLRRFEGESATSGRQDAASKMRAKMKEHMAIAGEFNIG
jgi:ATP-dependent RNA helicase DDX31/DBP7